MISFGSLNVFGSRAIPPAADMPDGWEALGPKGDQPGYAEVACSSAGKSWKDMPYLSAIIAAELPLARIFSVGGIGIGLPEDKTVLVIGEAFEVGGSIYSKVTG